MPTHFQAKTIPAVTDAVLINVAIPEPYLAAVNVHYADNGNTQACPNTEVTIGVVDTSPASNFGILLKTGYVWGAKAGATFVGDLNGDLSWYGHLRVAEFINPSAQITIVNNINVVISGAASIAQMFVMVVTDFT